MRTRFKSFVRHRPRAAAATPLLAAAILLAGCSAERPGDLADGEPLRVLTRNAPTTWYQGADGDKGPEHDLAQSFARYLGVPVEFVILDSIEEILEAVADNRGHLAAAGLTRTEVRLGAGLVFGPPYHSVTQQVVCRRGGEIPEDVSGLIGREIAVIAGSSYDERLGELKADYPELEWSTIPGVGTESLLAQVWNEDIDCTVADSNIVKINRRYHPELEVAFDLTEPQALAWILSPEWTALADDIEPWLASIEESGDLAVIRERYYGHVASFDYVDVSVFSRRIDERLPRYRSLFEDAAEDFDLPWTLLAAQAYQESHWDPEATSPTGVRGIMMLSERTAESLEVTDRLDPAQSIFGGARYLHRMLERVPDDVEETDRIWFALVAYNIGFAHLRDALTLADRLGKNPNRWVDLKEVLPMLSRREYYRDLEYGYARGEEPVAYIGRIRDYRSLLQKSLE